ncbi:response regulator transcription factor [Paenibacillus xerothermodurans]|uniref:Response regulator n=1 Tax=Paenibacillus xerothermodurans TaxID=1977292 RepID=A0A2W1NVD9_PAEXE|nr:helix-turn-helix domain-containing protein [Paenibacillus xerothermodurans]PZE21736.1 response regulator [Paenibacillus xerothermodurans]
MKICIVDDEKEVRLSIIQKLKTLFPLAEIFDAGFGRDALAQITVVQPDLVFMDIRMPEMDGLAILRALRPLYPDLQVVILSGYDDFEYARQALHLGATGYLLKPADRDELRDIVHKVQLDMQDRFMKEIEGHLRRLSAQYIFVHDILCYNTSLWFDERRYKAIYFGNTDALRKRWQENAGDILATFSINFDYGGAIVQQQPGAGSAGFRAKEDFATALIAGIERWESERFFDGVREDSLARGKARKDAHKQAAQRRQDILAAAKTGNYEQLKSALEEWLGYLEDLDFTSLRKECVNLMALLDEGLSKPDVVFLEEEKIHYWWQWVAKHKTWVELRERIRHFVLDGIYAVLRLESQPSLHWFEQALQLVDTSHDANLSLESVAEVVGVHPVTLSRIFKQQTGVNFVRYIVRRRMKHAQYMLLNTDKKINEIAEEIGYVDHRYFRTLFKKEFGLTPSEFRKQHGNSTADEAD